MKNVKKPSVRYQRYLNRYRMEPPVKDWKPRRTDHKPRRRVLGVWVK